jgi:DNA N-6-adenine-methyltransferase (Dam).
VSAPAYLSSACQDWETPGWFLELVRQIGPIGLDPCTTDRNPVGARQILTPAEDALNCAWPALRPGEVCYANTPYGRALAAWVPRIVVCAPPNTLVLAPAGTETRWFRELWGWADVVGLWNPRPSVAARSRIQFCRPGTASPVPGSTVRSALFFQGPLAERFCEVFEDYVLLVV